MFEELLDIYKADVAQSEKKLKEAQAMIGLVLAVEKMSKLISSRQQDIELLGRLIDQVDHLSKEVADLKSQMKTRQPRLTVEQPHNTESGNALDNHTKTLIDLMKERPGQYTTGELVDMLGLNKTTVISVMKRAAEMEPRHVKLTQGKRRKLYLSYVPESGNNKESTGVGSDDDDRMKRELMAMT